MTSVRMSDPSVREKGRFGDRTPSLACELRPHAARRLSHRLLQAVENVHGAVDLPAPSAACCLIAAPSTFPFSATVCCSVVEVGF
jgi:hypothetical protein